ncbi:Fpg/Nei family DNA glycosylase [Nocardioides daejeonensis]|uniref:Fpg/Nei family DNA glycosylase n=1 Tax=Nocardioides daejeonensis TaxID=1046556 RepID=UPI000D749A2A|nr:DNA-formamidopyrimidine glycosylase family protein [Nocardioides daejeonensis]
MPEGDTVHRTARRLRAALTGSVLTACDFRVPQLATVDLRGRAIGDSTARGKHLLLRIGDDLTLHTHLKMEGSWHLYRPGTSWERPTHEARVVLETTEWQAVGFALGVVELLRRDAEAEAVGHLGPDLLGPDWDPEVALDRLRAAPGVPVGEALLDQRNLAGIGNMYQAEVLFLCGTDPHTPVGEVERLPRVLDRARAVLTANVGRAIQSTTGNLAPGKRLWVYRRSGSPCLRCRTTIRTGMLGAPGRERATYWCPTCQ